jgi:hypothetical protein
MPVYLEEETSHSETAVVNENENKFIYSQVI